MYLVHHLEFQLHVWQRLGQ